MCLVHLKEMAVLVVTVHYRFLCSDSSCTLSLFFRFIFVIRGLARGIENRVFFFEKILLK